VKILIFLFSSCLF